LESGNRECEPAIDEIEVSLLGPGYGEAVAVHLGNNQWVLVDSCIEPGSREPASLRYLRSLGVDVSTAVKLVVATHWHDDHIRGVSDLFRECTSARFVVSSALQTEDFLTLLALYDQPVMRDGSGLDEFASIFGSLKQKNHTSRGKLPGFALADRVLFRTAVALPQQIVFAQVFSLSPSDAVLLQAQLAFSNLLPVRGTPKRRIASPSRNEATVALWFQIGSRNLLLGADVERSGDPKLGWNAILDDSTVVTGQADAFKVAHHGAESGHEPRVWTKLLYPDPVAILSPFRSGGTFLPSPTDVDRIRSLTPNAYITAPSRRKQHKWGNKVVRDMVRETTRTIQNADYGWGHVRIRSRVSCENLWEVELFGDAMPL
jgi:hypothetical protein